jgi:hypothetical protein
MLIRLVPKGKGGQPPTVLMQQVDAGAVEWQGSGKMGMESLL